MDHAFWQSRWDSRQIGFHEGTPNAFLTKHGGLLELAPEKRVLVPLCGKTMDLVWLAARAQTVGVEFVERAVDELFDELKVTPERTGARRRHGSLEVVAGDYFARTADEIGRFDAVYDRAALIALEPSTRARYAAHTVSLAKPGARLLVVGFSYDTATMTGPPFAVDAAAIHALYAPYGEVRQVDERDVTEESPRFKERGASWVREAAFLVTLR